MNNREQILRNLEYLGGGVDMIKTMCNKNSAWVALANEWCNIISNTITLIEEDYQVCQGPLKNSLR